MYSEIKYQNIKKEANFNNLCTNIFIFFNANKYLNFQLINILIQSRSQNIARI